MKWSAVWNRSLSLSKDHAFMEIIKKSNYSFVFCWLSTLLSWLWRLSAKRAILVSSTIIHLAIWLAHIFIENTNPSSEFGLWGLIWNSIHKTCNLPRCLQCPPPWGNVYVGRYRITKHIKSRHNALLPPKTDVKSINLKPFVGNGGNQSALHGELMAKVQYIVHAHVPYFVLIF